MTVHGVEPADAGADFFCTLRTLRAAKAMKLQPIIMPHPT